MGAACQGLSRRVLWNLGWSVMEKLCRAVFQKETVKCKDASFVGGVLGNTKEWTRKGPHRA